MRKWSNTEGTKDFEAEIISRQNDQVTLRRGDGSQLEFAIEKLHKADQQWLDLNYPAKGEPKATGLPPENAIFDTLVFGDKRETVAEKLQASKFVSSKVAGTFLGRTGLNGVYHTTHKIGGLLCYLFFDWDASGGLQEVTLQTEVQFEEAYTDILKPCWEECIPLISSIHGKPLRSANIVDPSLLQDGEMLATHIWKIEHGGSIMLGTAKDGRGYQVVVRFTREVVGQDNLSD